MKLKKVDLERYASQIVGEKGVLLTQAALKGFGEYDGVVLGWVSGPREYPHTEICDIEVTCYRNDEKEIRYCVDFKTYGEGIKFFSMSDTVEEAFAVRDLLDEVIKDFKAKWEGGNGNAGKIESSL